LGLAPRAGSLEPMERRMGSAALRAEPLRRGLGRPLRLERSLWGCTRPLRRVALVRLWGRFLLRLARLGRLEP